MNETMDTEDQMLMIMDALNDTVTPVPELELSARFYIKQRLLELDTINTP